MKCLIWDDSSKERTTEAGLDYLYQIIDYRYRHELQTIVITNALNSEELSYLSNNDFVVPMVSRLLERGEWVVIEDANDYRIMKNNRKYEVSENDK